ncbi:MAG: carboxypeptidase regulatory-like domain-containing protein [Patescibacteria group bacterium]
MKFTPSTPRPFSSRAFTLVEVIVGAAVFLVIALAAYNSYIGLFKLIDLGQYRVLAVSLANEQFEVARNMPYADVGVVGSIPVGKIQHTQNLTRGGVPFTVTTIVRNVDLAFDGTIGGTPNDLSPADNKLVEVTVSCTGCRNMAPIILAGQVAPKNLETASTNGALFIRVFDASGQPIEDANVHVVNVATTTTIVIDDVTDVNGMLQLVDLPPGTNAYRITVTKNGYSTDRTYAPNAPANPFPTKSDATVLVQQVTQISFAIDLLGSLSFSSVTPLCVPVSNFDFNLQGSKEIGDDIFKYVSTTTTNGIGTLSIPGMEWDTYVVKPLDTTHDLAGINPLNPVILNPGAAQSVQLVVIPKDPKSLLVTVKDSATQLPISGATVTLTKTGYSNIQTTGKGYINQTDWSGGSGAADYVSTNKYWIDDGRVDVTSTPGDVRLKNVFGSYNSSGVLESSTFNTGSPSNFYTLTWQPTDPPLLAGNNAVRFQVATNATVTATTTWDFKGPDGTAATYYATSSSPIHASNNGYQFFRYRLYLATQTATVTPNVSDTAFTFTSSCTPPGQVIFTALTAGTYTLNIAKAGYTTYNQNINVSADWAEVAVPMAP